jgi:hypothetical protein
MKIGIIGTGNIGGTLGKLWSAKGHSIKFSARNPNSEKTQALLRETGASVGTNAEVAAFGEVILLAAPFPEVEGILKEIGDFQHKVLIDATNRFDGKSAGEEVLRLAQNARVVKSFNSLGWEVLLQPSFDGVAATMFVTGDDANAKAQVSQLITEIGLDPVDMGGAANISKVEFAALTFFPLLLPKFGREFALRVLRR